MASESFSSSSSSLGTLIGLADAVAIVVLFSKVSTLESRLEQYNGERRFLGGNPGGTASEMMAGILSGSSDHHYPFFSRSIEGPPSQEASSSPPAQVLIRDALSRVSSLERGFASVTKRTDDLQNAVVLLSQRMKELSATSNLLSKTVARSALPPPFPSSMVAHSPPSMKPPTTAVITEASSPTEEQSLVELGW